MPTTVIPQPTPISQLDVTWPQTSDAISEGGAFTTTADTRYGPFNSRLTLWGALVGTGTTVMSRQHNNEVITGRWRGAVADVANRPLGGFPINCPLTVQAWPAAFRCPEAQRVYRVSFLMSVQGGNPTEQTGLAFIVSAGTVGGWVVAGVNTGAFGIAGDGAGGFNFFRKKGAGTYLTTALAWPNAITELVKVEFQMQAADGRGAANLSLLINDVAVALPALASSWGAGTQLPEMPDGSVVNSNKFVPVVQANDGVAIDLHIAYMRCIMGHFNFDGSER